MEGNFICSSSIGSPVNEVAGLAGGWGLNFLFCLVCTLTFFGMHVGLGRGDRVIFLAKVVY